MSVLSAWFSPLRCPLTCCFHGLMSKVARTRGPCSPLTCEKNPGWVRCVWVLAWTQSRVAHPALSQCSSKLAKLQEQEDALYHHGNGNQSVAATLSFLALLTEQ